MMQTRCPACGTSFQVTPEQMRAKGGKVRCGHCRVVFNALAYLMVKVTPETPSTPASPAITQHGGEVDHALSPIPSANANPSAPAIVAPLRPAREVAPVDVSDLASVPATARSDKSESSQTPPLSRSSHNTERNTDSFENDESLVSDVEDSQAIVSLSHSTKVPTIAPPTQSRHSHSKIKERGKEKRSKKPTEQSKSPARQTARMADPIDEVAGASRWPSHEDLIVREQAPWLQTTLLLLLSLGLIIQIAYYFRTEVVSQFPEARAVYTYFNIPVGLPKNVDLVSIDASDLQADPSTKQLVLQAVLANRATYPQAWPALELSLTDTEDKVLARRILYPKDYQRDKNTDPIFPARQEFSINLHLDGENLTPAGYHLYVFYP